MVQESRSAQYPFIYICWPSPRASFSRIKLLLASQSATEGSMAKSLKWMQCSGRSSLINRLGCCAWTSSSAAAPQSSDAQNLLFVHPPLCSISISSVHWEAGRLLLHDIHLLISLFIVFGLTCACDSCRLMVSSWYHCTCTFLGCSLSLSVSRPPQLLLLLLQFPGENGLSCVCLNSTTSHCFSFSSSSGWFIDLYRKLRFHSLGALSSLLLLLLADCSLACHHHYLCILHASPSFLSFHTPDKWMPLKYVPLHSFSGPVKLLLVENWMTIDLASRGGGELKSDYILSITSSSNLWVLNSLGPDNLLLWLLWISILCFLSRNNSFSCHFPRDSASTASFIETSPPQLDLDSFLVFYTYPPRTVFPLFLSPTIPLSIYLLGPHCTIVTCISDI